MIHSLAGGELKNTETNDWAKVEILEGAEIGNIHWFKFYFLPIKTNSIVMVPIGFSQTPTRAKVLEIKKSISQQMSPIPSKHASYILSVVIKE